MEIITNILRWLGALWGGFGILYHLYVFLPKPSRRATLGKVVHIQAAMFFTIPGFVLFIFSFSIGHILGYVIIALVLLALIGLKLLIRKTID